MRAPAPILAADLFTPLNDELVALLRGLSDEEWSAPTVAGTWTVKDVAAHLLDTSMRRVAVLRDGWRPPLPPGAFDDGVGAYVNRLNRDWIAVATRLSPRMLIEMHELYGPALAEAMSAIDPFAPAPLAVSWAGEDESPGWFDVARELTEKWHHQQQIRDAAGRPPLYDGYLAPVIETFVRALPFTYRDVDAPAGTAIVLRIDGASWSVVRDRAWDLFAGDVEHAATRVTMTGDRAWRVFTRQRIDPQAVIEGEARYAEPLLRMVSIV
jgi:uncharacterized protein (TIGR03083 family)